VQVVYLDSAKEDLDSIWDYTAETWSLDQADTYVDQIQRLIAEAAIDPVQLKPWPFKASETSRLRANHHYVFVRQIGGELVVIRILHEKMDFFRHLEP